MNLKNRIVKSTITLTLVLCTYIAQSQETPTVKYFDESTIHEVKIDYDKDGDMDYIVAGVISEKNQGRVYLIENKGAKLGKPVYIFSFPTIPKQQHLNIQQKDNVTTINVIGTSPEGKQTNFIGTLYKGAFAGLIIPPVTSDVRKLD